MSPFEQWLEEAVPVIGGPKIIDYFQGSYTVHRWINLCRYAGLSENLPVVSFPEGSDEQIYAQNQLNMELGLDMLK